MIFIPFNASSINVSCPRYMHWSKKSSQGSFGCGCRPPCVILDHADISDQPFYRNHYMTPTQTMHCYGGTPQIYHLFALFDPPQNGYFNDPCFISKILLMKSYIFFLVKCFSTMLANVKMMFLVRKPPPQKKNRQIRMKGQFQNAEDFIQFEHIWPCPLLNLVYLQSKALIL